ncbi:SDR family NAD(P)-dependent oxidoreductase [Streptomyces sp. NPDC006798]|uniref:SDR family NAD(P)-dependent oxidoreductase n=1 Tax=Streptomyces sp. NPDC006798 TaxID=3155462 RepID=UPI0033D6BD14
MRTIVITGGTDGMGAALARHYLAAGDRVTVIGRSRTKFDTLVAEAVAASGDAGRDHSSGDHTVNARAEFIAADLSLVAESRRVVELLKARYRRVDALILAASFVRRHRLTTAEGHEATWALFFLGKYVLVTGLAPLLRASDRPVIVNTAVPGAPADAVDFADPELTRGFTARRANARQRRANELLGLLATADNSRLAYATWGPARLVGTGFAGDIGPGLRLTATVLGRLLGQRPEVAVRPVVRLVDDPVPGRSAHRGAAERPLTVGADDAGDAARLAAVVVRDL